MFLNTNIVFDSKKHNYSQLHLFEMVYKSKALICKQDTREQDMMALRRENICDNIYTIVIKM